MTSKNQRNRTKPAAGDPSAETTGRYLVTFRPESRSSLLAALRDASVSAVATADFSDGIAAQADAADGVLFEHLHVAVVDVNPEQLVRLNEAAADDDSAIASIEPERYVDAIADGRFDEGYLRGFVAGVNNLAEQLLRGVTAPDDAGSSAQTYVDTAELTWGLQAVRAHQSRYTGKGVRVAVLDTGMELTHPDFTGRSLTSATFVPGEVVRDVQGHGTHCIGTACGPTAMSGERRHGLAGESHIFVGKVLSNAGRGQDAWILNGINWAIENRVAVVSMSLGRPVAPGEVHSPAYERAAKSALEAGTLIVAAAGNAGDTPVGSPANCPSIMAVAAVDSRLRRASFSCVGGTLTGSEVNIAGPGVDVFSSFPLPGRHRVMSGTSMATPHVAGCAALWVQSTGLRGRALWQKLLSTAVNLGLPAQHVGSGLVQAPT